MLSFAMSRRLDPPVPTLGQLSRSPGWFWADCNNRDCTHRRPLPFVPFVIRWGPQTSSDVLRRNLRCTKCGHRGAATMMPSWIDMQVGEQPFPTL
jgi:hypothetical protein